VRGKGHGVTPTSLYNNPRKRNPSNAEVMQTLQDLQAQVRELQRDKERYMAERSSSQLKETSDKASINCQHKFPEVIKMIIHYI
jgi:spore coat protein CotF